MAGATQARPGRRSRAEAREETRRRLREAAWDVFIERGFGAASVEEIAARAGFTCGAFYSNYPDKDAIFLDLMDERLAVRVDGVTEVMKASSPLALFDDLRSWRSGVADDPAWLSLLTEFRAHALRHEPSRQRLAARERTLRQLYARAIEAQFEAVGVAPPAPAADLALIVQALDHWFGVFEALAPDQVPDGTFFDALALLFRATVALSEQNTGQNTG